jgi:hypothetical protein
MLKDRVSTSKATVDDGKWNQQKFKGILTPLFPSRNLRIQFPEFEEDPSEKVSPQV